MPVVQIQFDVPIDIARGIATGQLQMLGTAAVRNDKHIVAHIRAVSRTINDGDKPAAFAKALRNPKLAVFGIGAVAVAAVGGGLALWARSRKQSGADVESPGYVTSYNASLAAYLEAIATGNLGADLIARLISDLDALKEHADRGTISLELSVQDSEQLVGIIGDYTIKLAEANAVELGELEAEESESPDGVIVEMRHYLVAQQQIFEESA